MALDVRVGDVVQMRKPHACGTNRWRVYRMGADVGIRCLGCERRVMLTRRDFTRAVKRLLETPQDSQ